MSKAKITEAEVRTVAMLANLPLSKEELKIYSQQLSAILDAFDNLASCQTEKVPPTFTLCRHFNVMREDKPQHQLSQKEALSNARLSFNGLFVADKVLKN